MLSQLMPVMRGVTRIAQFSSGDDELISILRLRRELTPHLQAPGVFEVEAPDTPTNPLRTGDDEHGVFPDADEHLKIYWGCPWLDLGRLS